LDWHHCRPSRLNFVPITFFILENESAFFDALFVSGFLLIIIFSLKKQTHSIKEKALYLSNIGFHNWAIIVISIIASCSHLVFSKRILAYNNNIQGYISMHLGKLNIAEKYFQKALSYDPTYQKTNLNMGTVFMHKKEYEKACHYFNNVLNKEPENETAHLQLGIIYLKEKKLERAFIHLKKVLMINPKSIQAHEDLGYLYFAQNKYSEAIKHFQSVVDLDPANINGLYNLAIALSHFGNTDASIDLLSDVLIINPLYVEAHDNIGVAYVNKGNIEKAVMHFHKAMQINPAYQSAQKHFESLTKRIFDFARSCENNHKLNKAISLYQKLSEFRPEWSGSLYYNISRIYAQINDVTSAVNSLKKAVENNFCSWDVLKSEKQFETIKHHPYYQGLIRKKE
jgi:tetratricopeptide (TPR) repeat protein